ncbi:MAG: type I methionyl aminopeptidase [Proteobacteria bacterium]|nr:type I methionyl aminopeptidase [Pseudomonadota bacterium]
MITYKTNDQIEIMTIGGKISSNALQIALEMAKEGVSLREIDQEVEKFILKNKAKPSFKTVSGYHYSTCININDGLVHGIPNNYRLKTGDLVKIDLGVLYDGFHTDTSATKEINTNFEEKFLEAGRVCIEEAVKKCQIGNKLGDISYAMQHAVESRGYTVSRSLVGHGIGTSLHEDPLVPPYGKPGTGITLKEGMVLAIEIIYQKGSYHIKTLEDGWTISTKDGSLGGLWEHTVAITRKGPLVLTK